MNALLSYASLRPDLVANWDPTQFALATESFDLAQHHPHPPGCIGHVALASVLRVLASADQGVATD